MDPYTSTYILSRSTLLETLDDLCVRFILNIPEEELNSIERLSFQIEAAQWYFEDFIRDINPSLPTLNLRSFISKIFAVLPLPVIAGLPADGAENAFINFMSYKTRVPVRGAIILNPTMDKLLLVKGYKKGASWSYPRGKINKDEDDMVCAIREVFEETGFDCGGLAKEEDYVEIVMKNQNLRLYIIPGVSEDTVFECQTRKEISDIKWHRLTELPAYSKKKNGQQPAQNEVRIGKYYMVAPFLKDLRKWISTKGKKWLQNQQQQSLAAAANRIAEETEVEEELASPQPVDTSAQLRNYLNFPPPSEPAAANGYSSNDEASQKLKNMLLFGPQGDKAAQQADQSARLTNMLGASSPDSKQPQSQADVPLNVAQLGPNPRALLSILQNGSGTSALQVPQMNNQRLASPETPGRAPPPIQNFATSPQSPQSPQSQKRKQPKNLGVIGSSAGWPQFPRNVPESTTHLPSPPPSSYIPSQSTQYNYPPQNKMPHQPPQQQAFSPVNQNRFKPPKSQQPAQQAPPTPLDAFTPIAVSSKNPDPNQAGILLPIRKGASPAPQHVMNASPPVAATPSTPTSTRGNSQTTTSILQKPSIPKGPKAHTQQQATLLATLRSGSSRASTLIPGSQALTPPLQQPAYVSPSCSSTAGPQFRASPTTSGPSSRYTSSKPAGTAFGRRESISNQKQALLAMFRTGSSPPVDQAVMSSPEQSPARPVTSGRNRSMSRGSAVQKGKGEALKSPLGRERDGLMAYLEGVAKMGGQ